MDKEALTRKQALAKITTGLKKIALFSIPFAAAASFTETAKADIDKYEVTRMLNVLLQMEFVLKDFYLLAKNNNNLVPEPYSNAIYAIYDHHIEHLTMLKYRITKFEADAEPSPVLSANFNLNGLRPRQNFTDFLQIAQILEDASASLYKKMMPKIRAYGTKDILPRLLLLSHTTEARHSSYIRMLRIEYGVENVSPWVSNSINNAVLDDLQSIYTNEENTIQNDIDISEISMLPNATIKEAWDEPCTNESINNLFALLKVNYY